MKNEPDGINRGTFKSNMMLMIMSIFILSGSAWAQPSFVSLKSCTHFATDPMKPVCGSASNSIKLSTNQLAITRGSGTVLKYALKPKKDLEFKSSDFEQQVFQSGDAYDSNGHFIIKLNSYHKPHTYDGVNYDMLLTITDKRSSNITKYYGIKEKPVSVKTNSKTPNAIVSHEFIDVIGKSWNSTEAVSLAAKYGLHLTGFGSKQYYAPEVGGAPQVELTDGKSGNIAMIYLNTRYTGTLPFGFFWGMTLENAKGLAEQIGCTNINTNTQYSFSQKLMCNYKRSDGQNLYLEWTQGEGTNYYLQIVAVANVDLSGNAGTNRSASASEVVENFLATAIAGFADNSPELMSYLSPSFRNSHPTARKVNMYPNTWKYNIEKVQGDTFKVAVYIERGIPSSCKLITFKVTQEAGKYFLQPGGVDTYGYGFINPWINLYPEVSDYIPGSGPY